MGLMPVFGEGRPGSMTYVSNNGSLGSISARLAFGVVWISVSNSKNQSMLVRCGLVWCGFLHGLMAWGVGALIGELPGLPLDTRLEARVGKGRLLGS